MALLHINRALFLVAAHYLKKIWNFSCHEYTFLGIGCLACHMRSVIVGIKNNDENCSIITSNTLQEVKMKSFIIITGPHAVGKMTVGLQMKEKYEYVLFHNHMSIELVADVFGGLNKENFPLVGEIRQAFFNNVLKQNLDRFIFTYTWAFDDERDHAYVNDLVKRFEEKGYKVTIVELEASLDERLKRNKTDLRLEHKPTKRNLKWSEKDVISAMEQYRLNSIDNEVKHTRHIKINNEKLDAETVADLIYKKIHLKDE